MKVEVTFKDIIEAEDLEQAYDDIIKYLSEVVKYEDLTTFSFEEVEEE